MVNNPNVHTGRWSCPSSRLGLHGSWVREVSRFKPEQAPSTWRTGDPLKRCEQRQTQDNQLMEGRRVNNRTRKVPAVSSIISALPTIVSMLVFSSLTIEHVRYQHVGFFIVNNRTRKVPASFEAIVLMTQINHLTPVSERHGISPV